MRKIKHGIKFGKFHSYEDFGLIPTSRPVLPPPEPVIIKQVIPGRDEPLDYSKAICNGINFKQRHTEIEFLVTQKDEWQKIYENILNTLHGRHMQIVIDDDPDYYYEADIAVSEWKSNKMNSIISIDIVASQYKMKIRETTITKTITGAETIVCKNMRKRVVPVVEVSDSMTIKFGHSYSKSLEKGKHLLDIVFDEGENILNVTGNGTITITYREGSL